MKVFLDVIENWTGNYEGMVEKDFPTIKDAEVWCAENTHPDWNYYIDYALTRGYNGEES